MKKTISRKSRDTVPLNYSITFCMCDVCCMVGGKKNKKNFRSHLKALPILNPFSNTFRDPEKKNSKTCTLSPDLLISASYEGWTKK
jgi:hypothetical protein